MKIAVVCDVLGEETNGTTLAAANLIRHLQSQKDIELNVLCADQDKKDLPNYYVVPNLSFGKLIDSIIAKNNVKLAKPDDEIVAEALKDADHVHIMLPFVLGRHALKYCKEHGITTTAGFHAQAENLSSHFRLQNFELLNKAIYKNFYKGFYKDINGIHYPTQFIKDDFENRLKIKTNGYIISNGVNTVITKQNIEKPQELKDKIVILSTGRYAVEKNQQTLIRAVKYSKYKDKIQLIFAGQGPLENKFKKMAKKLPNYPIFKVYPRQEMTNVVNMCDLYVHPAIIELEGIACLEAICAGILGIVSDSKKSAATNFVVDQKCIFKNRNPKDLARVIDYWIEHPQEKRECEDKFLQSAEKYNQDKCMDKMIDMMIEVHKKYGNQ